MNAIVAHAAHQVSDIERMARAFAASKLFGVTNPEQALALCLVAQAEGRHPATAAQDYSIIQGRPSKKADAMLRDFLAAGGKVEWHTLSDEKADATFSHPAGGAARIDWTIERANKAGLGGNAMYKKYPRQMLRSRVVSEGVRTVCPGATSGMYVPEEVQDIVQEEVRRVPAEETCAELPEGVKTGRQLADEQAKPPSKAALKRSGIFEELRDEIDKCETLDELDAWNKRRERDIKSLPSDWYDALGDRFQIRQEELSGADNVSEAADELDEAFRATMGSGGPAPVSGSHAPHHPAR